MLTRVHFWVTRMNKDLVGLQKKLEILQKHRQGRNIKLGLKIDTKELCQGIPNSAGKKEEEVLKSMGRPL